MARPKKSRVICCQPKHRKFGCASKTGSAPICMTADEYEVLRLHDLEHFSQTEVAKQMLIARTTVTMLLASAHEKLTDAIVNGKALEIQDRNCTVCEIGSTCPLEKKEACTKRHRCGGSCRHQQQCQS